MTLRILIVDDREKVRRTLRETVELNLPEASDMEVEDMFPLDDIYGYASFIREHDISALLLDERLNEQGNPQTGVHTSYFGHDVVGVLRSALPNFPVYVITTYRHDSDLVAKEAEFEDVVERGEFQKDTEKYMHRIRRAASRFRQEMHEQLRILDALTLKAAQGTLTREEQDTLTAVRQTLGLPFNNEHQLVVSDLIADARSLAEDSERLISKLRGSG